jgi:Lipocalin / cytosolic fatty-acid binding protein family
MAQRMVAKAATPVVTYNVSGDEWTVLTTGLKDTTMKFKIGVEQDDETPDGRKVKVSHFIARTWL